MRRIILVLATVAFAVPQVAEAAAASKRECRAACVDQILACQDACVPFGGGFAAPGGRKLVKACRAGVLKRCRKTGVGVCTVSTTTSTVVPATTSTTMDGGSTTTTTVGPTSTLPPSTTTTTAPPSGLAGLIGRWRFQFTIISTFTQDYVFDHVETVDGIPVLVGSDEFGDPVIVARTADLGGGVPFEFAMLDPGVGLCDFFVFNRTGATSISGDYYLADVAFDGSCGDLIGGPYPLSGTRLSALLGAARTRAHAAAARLDVEALRVGEATSAGEPFADDEAQQILRRMQSLTH